MCSRCVRFTREISGTAELQVINRGTHAEIDIFPGQPCNNKLAGNVVDLCPVGALCSKDFLYKQRVWWLKTANSVCPDCSTGCSIHVDQNDDHVYRLRPRPNPQAQGHFMCDEGRFGWKYMHAEERLTLPEQRRDGKVVSRDWDVVLPAVRTALVEAARATRSKASPAVLSPWMTLEEAYLLASYLKSLSPNVTLAMGPVRVVGEDDKYPKDVHGRPVEPAKFTIRAEKCPNRRGVEACCKHFAGGVMPMGDVLGRAASGDFGAVYLRRRRSGGLDQRRAGGRARKASRRSSCRTFSRRPASRRATFVLAGRLVCRAGRHVRESCRAGAGDSRGRSAARARRGRTAASCGSLPGGAGCSTSRRCGERWRETIPALAPLAVGELGRARACRLESSRRMPQRGGRLDERLQ